MKQWYLFLGLAVIAMAVESLLGNSVQANVWGAAIAIIYAIKGCK